MMNIQDSNFKRGSFIRGNGRANRNWRGRSRGRGRGRGWVSNQPKYGEWGQQYMNYPDVPSKSNYQEFSTPPTRRKGFLSPPRRKTFNSPPRRVLLPTPKDPVRPRSPFPGTEEYTQRNIEKASDFIKKQLQIDENKSTKAQSSNFNICNINDQQLDLARKYNENQIISKNVISRENSYLSPFEKNSDFKISMASKNGFDTHISPKSNFNKNQKLRPQQTYNVNEIHNKLIDHISNLSHAKKMNIINQVGPSGYDLAVQQIQKQKRIELSQALREMCKEKYINENTETINSIIPDFDIPIENLPREIIAKLSSTLDDEGGLSGMNETSIEDEYLDFPREDFDLPDPIVPETYFRQAEDLLKDSLDYVPETCENVNDSLFPDVLITNEDPMQQISDISLPISDSSVIEQSLPKFKEFYQPSPQDSTPDRDACQFIDNDFVLSNSAETNNDFQGLDIDIPFPSPNKNNDFLEDIDLVFPDTTEPRVKFNQEVASTTKLKESTQYKEDQQIGAEELGEEFFIGKEEAENMRKQSTRNESNNFQVLENSAEIKNNCVEDIQENVEANEESREGSRDEKTQENKTVKVSELRDSQIEKTEVNEESRAEVEESEKLEEAEVEESEKTEKAKVHITAETGHHISGKNTIKTDTKVQFTIRKKDCLQPGKKKTKDSKMQEVFTKRKTMLQNTGTQSVEAPIQNNIKTVEETKPKDIEEESTQAKEIKPIGTMILEVVQLQPEKKEMKQQEEKEKTEAQDDIQNEKTKVDIQNCKIKGEEIEISETSINEQIDTKELHSTTEKEQSQSSTKVLQKLNSKLEAVSKAEVQPDETDAITQKGTSEKVLEKVKDENKSLINKRKTEDVEPSKAETKTRHSTNMQEEVKHQKEDLNDKKIKTQTSRTEVEVQSHTNNVQEVKLKKIKLRSQVNERNVEELQSAKLEMKSVVRKVEQPRFAKIDAKSPNNISEIDKVESEELGGLSKSVSSIREKEKMLPAENAIKTIVVKIKNTEQIQPRIVQTEIPLNNRRKLQETQSENNKEKVLSTSRRTEEILPAKTENIQIEEIDKRKHNKKKKRKEARIVKDKIKETLFDEKEERRSTGMQTEQIEPNPLLKSRKVTVIETDKRPPVKMETNQSESNYFISPADFGKDTFFDIPYMSSLPISNNPLETFPQKKKKHVEIYDPDVEYELENMKEKEKNKYKYKTASEIISELTTKSREDKVIDEIVKGFAPKKKKPETTKVRVIRLKKPHHSHKSKKSHKLSETEDVSKYFVKPKKKKTHNAFEKQDFDTEGRKSKKNKSHSVVDEYKMLEEHFSEEVVKPKIQQQMKERISAFIGGDIVESLLNSNVKEVEKKDRYVLKNSTSSTPNSEKYEKSISIDFSDIDKIMESTLANNASLKNVKDRASGNASSLQSIYEYQNEDLDYDCDTHSDINLSLSESVDGGDLKEDEMVKLWEKRAFKSKDISDVDEQNVLVDGKLWNEVVEKSDKDTSSIQGDSTTFSENTNDQIESFKNKEAEICRLEEISQDQLDLLKNKDGETSQDQLNLFEEKEEEIQRLDDITEEELDLFRNKEAETHESEEISQNQLSLFKNEEENTNKFDEIPQDQLNLFRNKERDIKNLDEIPQDEFDLLRNKEAEIHELEEMPQDHYNLYRNKEDETRKLDEIPQDKLNAPRNKQTEIQELQEISQDHLHLFRNKDAEILIPGEVTQDQINLFRNKDDTKELHEVPQDEFDQLRNKEAEFNELKKTSQLDEVPQHHLNLSRNKEEIRKLDEIPPDKLALFQNKEAEFHELEEIPQDQLNLFENKEPEFQESEDSQQDNGLGQLRNKKTEIYDSETISHKKLDTNESISNKSDNIREDEINKVEDDTENNIQIKESQIHLGSESKSIIEKTINDNTSNSLNRKIVEMINTTEQSSIQVDLNRNSETEIMESNKQLNEVCTSQTSIESSSQIDINSVKTLDKIKKYVKDKDEKQLPDSTFQHDHNSSKDNTLHIRPPPRASIIDDKQTSRTDDKTVEKMTKEIAESDSFNKDKKDHQSLKKQEDLTSNHDDSTKKSANIKESETKSALKVEDQKSKEKRRRIRVRNCSAQTQKIEMKNTESQTEIAQKSFRDQSIECEIDPIVQIPTSPSNNIHNSELFNFDMGATKASKRKNAISKLIEIDKEVDKLLKFRQSLYNILYCESDSENDSSEGFNKNIDVRIAKTEFRKVCTTRSKRKNKQADLDDNIALEKKKVKITDPEIEEKISTKQKGKVKGKHKNKNKSKRKVFDKINLRRGKRRRNVSQEFELSSNENVKSAEEQESSEDELNLIIKEIHTPENISTNQLVSNSEDTKNENVLEKNCKIEMNSNNPLYKQSNENLNDKQPNVQQDLENTQSNSNMEILISNSNLVNESEIAKESMGGFEVEQEDDDPPHEKIDSGVTEVQRSVHKAEVMQENMDTNVDRLIETEIKDDSKLEQKSTTESNADSIEESDLAIQEEANAEIIKENKEIITTERNVSKSIQPIKQTETMKNEIIGNVKTTLEKEFQVVVKVTREKAITDIIKAKEKELKISDSTIQSKQPTDTPKIEETKVLEMKKGRKRRMDTITFDKPDEAQSRKRKEDISSSAIEKEDKNDLPKTTRQRKRALNQGEQNKKENSEISEPSSISQGFQSQSNIELPSESVLKHNKKVTKGPTANSKESTPDEPEIKRRRIRTKTKLEIPIEKLNNQIEMKNTPTSNETKTTKSRRNANKEISKENINKSWQKEKEASASNSGPKYYKNKNFEMFFKRKCYIKLEKLSLDQMKSCYENFSSKHSPSYSNIKHKIDSPNKANETHNNDTEATQMFNTEEEIVKNLEEPKIKQKYSDKPTEQEPAEISKNISAENTTNEQSTTTHVKQKSVEIIGNQNVTESIEKTNTMFVAQELDEQTNTKESPTEKHGEDSKNNYREEAVGKYTEEYAKLKRLNEPIKHNVKDSNKEITAESAKKMQVEESTQQKCTEELVNKKDAEEIINQKPVDESSIQKNVSEESLQEIPEESIEEKPTEESVQKNLLEHSTEGNSSEKAVQKNNLQKLAQNNPPEESIKEKKPSKDSIKNYPEKNIYQKYTEKSISQKHEEESVKQNSTQKAVKQNFADEFVKQKHVVDPAIKELTEECTKNNNLNESIKERRTRTAKEKLESVKQKMKEALVQKENCDIILIDDNEKPLEEINFSKFEGAILAIKTISEIVLAASDRGKLYCYNIYTGQLFHTFNVCSVAITSICILKNEAAEHLIYTGSLDLKLTVFNFNTKQKIKCENVGEPIQCMEHAWNYLFIGSDRGSIIRYDILKDKIEAKEKVSDFNVLVLKATQEGARRVLLVATRNCPVSVRDAMSGLLMRIMETPFLPTVYCLLFEKNLVYCGTSQHDILVYTFEDGQLIFKHEATKSKGVVCMQIVGKLLFAGCYNGNIYVYNIENNKYLGSMSGPGGLMLSMEIIDGKIIVGTKSSKFKLWKIPDQYLRENKNLT